MLSRNRFKKGAASFYIVAISTLVLVIVSASFAAVIISELARTSNNDLAQSAYDSAMAGVEDAKLAYYNYIKCRDSGASAAKPNGDAEVKCNEIMWYMDRMDCYAVAHILGRIGEDDEVLIRETTNGDDKMSQAYTCAKINKNPGEYTISTGDGTTTGVAKVGLDARYGTADDVESIKLNLDKKADSLPSVVAVGMIQTIAKDFKLEDFDMTMRGQTDRGTVFLIPYTDEAEYLKVGDNEANKVYNAESGANIISVDGFLDSNNKTMPGNKPFAVYCPGFDSGKRCEIAIGLPKPVGWNNDEEDEDHKRSKDTFMITWTTYGKTRVGVEFCGQSIEEGSCDDSEQQSSSENGSSVIPTDGMQVVVDSTGRANDLFRRVEAVLEDTSAVSGSSLGLYNAVQADEIHKIEYALCEAKFGAENCDQQ